MITVKVTYTVKKEYVESNKKRIQAFLNAFKTLDNSQFVYSIFQLQDSDTFIHLSQYKNESIQQELLHVPSFLAFQQQRDLHLISDPTIEFLTCIGSSKNIL
ncbi:hypothetical protein LZQ00_11300 [Sphingobacterium sp. SRCM116780]|uniref:hypothetical protein n=1 Tax=Sphingobacterium sp. SRCM116780 TaxID=2907623 RepID=UPI001F262510|nr:hypothetical protein [Sphingobacterium sp. SRCM116780]UIR54864.1 hypothetical protein LZQ00_11300 [Sphingobacterium sp. SRCM116780]